MNKQEFEFISEHGESLKGPKFQFGKFFAVTLFRPTHDELGKIAGETIQKTSEKTSEKIIALIKQNPEISAGALSKEIGISSRAVEMQLSKLKQEGIIKRIGPDKGGHWEITA